MLIVALLFSFSLPALAATKQNYNINGTIIFETGSTLNESEAQPYVVISVEEHQDGSITIYQYEDGSLIEEHLTAPGSGVVTHTYYNNDGTIVSNVEITKENNYEITPYLNNDPYSNLASSASKRPLGYMHYRQPFNQTLYSTECYVIDEEHLNQEYTFYTGVADTLSGWIARIVSIFLFYVGGANIALEIIGGLGAFGVFDGAVSGVMTVLITKTIRCNYYNQEIHGDSTSHTGYKHVRLDGTYAFVTVDGDTQIITEGFTVRDWGTNKLGREMMYKMYGIDENPTSWTNLDK